MIKIDPCKQKFNEKYLNNLEQKVGHSIPNQYKEFLEKYNGGYPEGNFVNLNKSEIKSFSIAAFFGTKIEPEEDILSRYDVFKGRIPKGCIPIARTSEGNIICLNTNEEKYGYIFLWDHEKELMFEDGEITLNDLYFVANSFDKFLEMIETYKPGNDDLSGYKVKKVWVDPDFLKELEKD